MKTLFLAMLLVASSAFAQPGRFAKFQGDAEGREHMHKRVRMMVLLEIADALGLNETQTLQLSEKLKPFEAKRSALHDTVRDALQILRKAKENDAQALGQVNGAIDRLFDARVKLAELDKERWNFIAKDLNPQQRAALTLVFARMKAHMGGGRGGGEMHERRGVGKFHRFRQVN